MRPILLLLLKCSGTFSHPHASEGSVPGQHIGVYEAVRDILGVVFSQLKFFCKLMSRFV